MGKLILPANPFMPFSYGSDITLPGWFEFFNRIAAAATAGQDAGRASEPDFCFRVFDNLSHFYHGAFAKMRAPNLGWAEKHPRFHMVSRGRGGPT